MPILFFLGLGLSFSDFDITVRSTLVTLIQTRAKIITKATTLHRLLMAWRILVIDFPNGNHAIIRVPGAGVRGVLAQDTSLDDATFPT